MFDTHVHTNNSHDCKQTIDELCQSTINKGVRVISLTDHIDVFAYTEEHNSSVICGSAADAEYAVKTYGDKLKIFKGTEVGMYHYDAAMSNKICNLVDLDIVLGSVHSFMMDGKKIHFSRDIISEDVAPIANLIAQMDQYFDEMLITAETADIDVLCHLTYPMRYINGRYNRNLELNIYADKITHILKTLIERQIALEVNTARVGTDFDYTAPTFDIIKEYYNLGGKMITLASDAHTPQRVAYGFDYVKKELKSIGFDKYFYFEKRKPQSVKL